ncbi:hypothetical protein FRC03_006467 [Tulasnella sp. 419]|nr:hypothetical protein FRC02_004557 [Tulasnella sp. 418]KAG8960510.1 hypothetical protein FRC03_006467 [Tulasnella sp. 419]
MAPSKVKGKTNSIAGTIQSRVGGFFGMRNYAANGRDKHMHGEAEYKAAKVKGHASGTGDRISGKKDSILGGITGNRTRQARGNARNDRGSAKQSWNH